MVDQRLETAPGLDAPAVSPLRRVVGNASWLAGGNVVAFAAVFLQGLILARALAPAEFGTIALVIAIVDVAHQLVGSRVWEAATKFVSEFRAAGEPIRASAAAKLCYVVDAVGGIVAYGVLTIGSVAIARLFLSYPSLSGEIGLYALSAIVLAPVATSRALLRLAGRFRWLAGLAAAEALTRLALVGALALFSAVSISSVLVVYLAASLATGLGVLLLAGRAWETLGLARWNDAPLKALSPDGRRIRSFLFHSNLSGTFRLLTSRADILAVGWFTDPASAGVYRLARSLSDPLVALSDPVYHAVYPEMSERLHRGDRTGAGTLASEIRRKGWAVVVPVCVLATLLAPWVIPVLFGEPYTPAVPLTRILVWQLIWIPYLWMPALLSALGRAATLARMAALDAAVFVVALLVLVPRLGAIGAAIATVIRFAAWTCVAIWMQRRADRELGGVLR
jgi:O-antigen/teichoic acid export membrane protein